MNPECLLQHFDQIAEAPDAVPRLRRFVLDLAVRGKLVEQDPNDEPASELVKRIENEVNKAEAITSFSAEIDPPFEIPNSWVWAQVGGIAYVEMGQSPPSEYYNKSVDGLPFYQGKADFGKRNPAPRYWCSQPTKLAKKDDILISVRAPVGPTNVASEECCIGRGLAAIRPHKGVNLELFLYWLQGFELKIAEIGFGTTFIAINKKQLVSFPLPLPPLDEQHRIVAKVDELMALCDELEAVQTKREKRRDRLVAATLHGLNSGDESGEPGIRPTFEESARFYFNHLPRLTSRPAHIHQLRQTILNLAVRGKLVPQDPNDEPASCLLERVDIWRVEGIQRKLLRAPRKLLKKIEFSEMPYTLPAGWAWARFGDLIYIQSGDGLTAANMKDGNIPVYGGNGVNGYHDVFNIAEPTIVIGRVGYYCGSVHLTPERAWVTDNAFITKFCSREIFLEFLILLLKATNLKENENATAQPVISGSKIYPIVVGIPPLAEQHRIVAKLDKLMTLFDELEAGLIATATTRCQLLEAMLHEALSGQPKIRQESFQ
jgi:type I restriction enzyme, S subunit